MAASRSRSRRTRPAQRVAAKVLNTLSICVRSRAAFLAIMACACAVKITASFFVPTSSELQEIFLMAYGQIQGATPWGSMESAILLLWQKLSSSAVPYGWWNQDPSTVSNNIRLFVLLLRLPAFAFDLATAGVLHYAVLMVFPKRVDRARLASLVWFLNPYTFFAVEALAVPDVAVALLTVFAAILIARGRTAFSALALAAGTALKLYPLLILPALLTFAARKHPRRLTWIFLAVVPFLGFIAYLSWLMPGGFSAPALTNYSSVTQSMRELFLQMPGARLSLATMALVVLYIAIYAAARFTNPSISELIMPILLVFFAFSEPFPQYYLWVLPFLALDIALRGSRSRVALLFTLTTLLFAGWFIASQGFLTPSGYSLLLFPLNRSNMPSYSIIVSEFLKDPAVVGLLYPLLQAALYATTLVYALEIVRGWFKPFGVEMNSKRSHTLGAREPI